MLLSNILVFDWPGQGTGSKASRKAQVFREFR
jgi:hypothetical protein